MIDPIRLEQILAQPLKNGAHDAGEGYCVMEAAAFVAGEPHSDHPTCACPVIAAFLRAWNDALPDDAARDRLLKPLIPVVVGTRATPEIESRRALLAADWLIRTWTPAWFDLVPALAGHAATLRSLEEIADTAGLVASGERLSAASRDAAAARAAARDAARDAAGAAAWAAARAAAWDAAWAAARAAAWEAARDAAWAAAGEAARDAAWDAARAAARAAARDAVGAAAWAAAHPKALAAFAPTTERLQVSAQDLVRRMAAVQQPAANAA